jgi:GNAT superfamily N-acetyltransferase
MDVKQDRTNRISIRPPGHAECSEISELCFRSKAFWGYDEGFMKACRNELLVSQDILTRQLCFLIFHNTQMAGFYALNRMSPDTADLSYFFIDPIYIGQGYGKRLFLHACSTASNSGFHTLRIESDPFATGFYLKMGAKDVGQTPSKSIEARMLPLLEFNLAQWAESSNTHCL